MSSTSETRQLSLHPLAIHTFIKAQAGSLGKALSEAVMNSLDAFAANVNVQLTTNGFVIEDDGQGFKAREEIAAWFETLGFPHDEGNHRMYGKFGMGRAQMWAFARTVWTSNAFEMDVDVKARGLNYELREARKPHAGTKIEARFYEPLHPGMLERAIMELSNLVKYVPGLVTLNGRVVNKDPSTEQWDLETPEAYFRFDSKAYSLDVYNAGMLVAHFPRYRFGCSGVVVTKNEHTLALNLARNDILESECRVWPKVKANFPKVREKKAAPAPKKSQSDLKTLMSAVKSGSMSLRKATDEAPSLVCSVYGRGMGSSSLLGGWQTKPVVVVPKGNEFGKRLSKLKLAEVLSTETLTQWGLTLEEFRQLCRKENESYGAHWLTNFDKRVWSDKPEELFPALAAGQVMKADSELTDVQKSDLQALRRAFNSVILSCIRKVLNKQDRDEFQSAVTSVSIGDSPLEQSWLDTGAKTWVLREKEFNGAFDQALPQQLQYLFKQFESLLQKVYGEEKGTQTFVYLLTHSGLAGALALNIPLLNARARNREGVSPSGGTLHAATELSKERGVDVWLVNDPADAASEPSAATPAVTAASGATISEPVAGAEPVSATAESAAVPEGEAEPQSSTLHRTLDTIAEGTVVQTLGLPSANESSEAVRALA